MTDRKAPDSRSAETLIEEAHDARVAAHVRAMLSRLRSRVRRKNPDRPFMEG
jgi:hypothetical protein